MEKKTTHLQDEFLNQLRKEHVSVSIYLMNGIKLQGNIESFDQYAILLKNTVSQLVYKTCYFNHRTHAECQYRASSR